MTANENLSFNAINQQKTLKMEKRIDFEAWVKENIPTRCTEIVKGELMTFIRLRGLAYLSQAVGAFKQSMQKCEMRDIQFKGDRLIIAYANDWEITNSNVKREDYV